MSGEQHRENDKKPVVFLLAGKDTRAFANDERMKVPEPSSGMLLIIGFATLALRRRT